MQILVFCFGDCYVYEINSFMEINSYIAHRLSDIHAFFFPIGMIAHRN